MSLPKIKYDLANRIARRTRGEITRTCTLNESGINCSAPLTRHASSMRRTPSDSLIYIWVGALGTHRFGFNFGHRHSRSFAETINGTVLRAAVPADSWVRLNTV